MNTIQIDKIVKEQNKIICFYTIKGAWEKYFTQMREICIEYSIDISQVPDSICVIPFIGNVLPLVWLLDAELLVDTIDKEFYEHLPEIRKGYQEMYPMLDFKGKVRAKQIEEYRNNEKLNTSACFFSGGVDAYTTLFQHIGEQPYLLTVWGADIKLEDTVGWKNVWQHTREVAHEFGLKAISIKSDFRSIVDEGVVSEFVKKSGDDWWHGFQCGIGIITHAAPIAFILNIGKVYIASSNAQRMKGQYTCASDPTIDNYIFYANGQTIHDGYEWDRQQKIQYIIKRKQEEKKQVSLRVCWESSGGKNCCRCEKCYRTILEIVSEGENPNLYGFQWDIKGMRQCKYDMKFKIMLYQFNVDQFYLEIQKKMIQNRNYIDNYQEYKWLEDYDFSRFNDGVIKKINNSNIMSKFRRLKKKYFHRNKG